jgi:hypothetical protein
MVRRWRSFLPAAALIVAACAAEAPDPDPLPLPPPPPPRLQAQRAALPPVRNGAEAVPPSEQSADGQAAAAAAVPEPIWRVARDGTTGCADRAALRVLSQADGATPRLLAEARAAGGCRTTFRINEWVLETREDDAVRLRLVNGAALTLWFARGDVVPP